MHLCLLSLRNLLTWVNGRRLCGKNRRLENAIFFNKRHCLRSPLAFWQRCCRLFSDAAWTVFQFKPIFALKEKFEVFFKAVFFKRWLNLGFFFIFVPSSKNPKGTVCEAPWHFGNNGAIPIQTNQFQFKPIFVKGGKIS